MRWYLFAAPTRGDRQAVRRPTVTAARAQGALGLPSMTNGLPFLVAPTPVLRFGFSRTPGGSPEPVGLPGPQPQGPSVSRATSTESRRRMGHLLLGGAGHSGVVTSPSLRVAMARSTPFLPAA